LAICVGVGFLTGCGPAGDDPSIDGSRFVQALRPVPGQYIVVFKDDYVQAETLDEDVADLAHGSQGEVLSVYKHAVRGYASRMSVNKARGLLADPRVAYVEEDGVMTADATQSGATWGIDRIDQRALPLSGSYTYNVTGSGVNAYIVDTGIRTTHTEFGGRASGAYTAVTDGNGTNDCNGHGTHVAGTVGSATYGVAKGVRLYAVRVLDCNGSGTTSGVIAGVDWVTQNHVNPAVANMSLGGGVSTTLDSSVASAISAGVTFAVAAGNSNVDACTSSPSRVASAITVGATTNTDARASYSNFGTCLDLFAPGSNITSTWNTSDSATNTISGTSMATPHVTGAAALYLGANPASTPQQVRDALVNNSTASVVTSAGTGSPNKLLYTAFIGGGTTDTTAPTVSISSPTAGSTVSGTVTITATASDNVGVTRVELYVDGALLATDTASPYTASWNTSTATNAAHSLTAKAYDAAGNVGTSAAVSVTVSNAGGGTCATTTQLLGNPGFESGATVWTASTSVIDNSTGAAARTGSWKAWLDGYGSAHTDSLSQSVTIPAGACTATFSFWLRITTAETTTTTAYDKLTVTVKDSAGNVLGTLATYSNLNASSAYAQKTFDLKAYAGRAVTVSFSGVEDSSLQTSFLIDDTAVTVTQ
jgi:hypothetical protein